MESRETTKTRPKPRLLMGDARDYEEIMTRQEVLYLTFLLCNQPVGKSRLTLPWQTAWKACHLA